MNEATNILHKNHPKQTKQNKETANKLKHIINREQKRMQKQYNYTRHQIHIIQIKQKQKKQQIIEEQTNNIKTQNKEPTNKTTQKNTKTTGLIAIIHQTEQNTEKQTTPNKKQTNTKQNTNKTKYETQNQNKTEKT